MLPTSKSCSDLTALLGYLTRWDDTSQFVADHVETQCCGGAGCAVQDEVGNQSEILDDALGGCCCEQVKAPIHGECRSCGKHVQEATREPETPCDADQMIQDAPDGDGARPSWGRQAKVQQLYTTMRQLMPVLMNCRTVSWAWLSHRQTDTKQVAVCARLLIGLETLVI